MRKKTNLRPQLPDEEPKAAEAEEATCSSLSCSKPVCEESSGALCDECWQRAQVDVKKMPPPKYSRKRRAHVNDLGEPVHAQAYIVIRVCDMEIRNDDGTYRFLIQWADGDRTWEPLENLRYNIVVEEWIRKNRGSKEINDELYWKWMNTYFSSSSSSS